VTQTPMVRLVTSGTKQKILHTDLELRSQ
jgi:hypothetical protein